MKKIVYFHSEDELIWHGGRDLDDLLRDDRPNVYSHLDLLRQLGTAKGWTVVTRRVDGVYAEGG